MSVLSQATGVLVAVVATLGWVALAQGEVPPAGVLVWGAASGPGSGTGNAALYRGLARGEMSVVAPTSAVVTVLVPAAVGLGTGDRPAAAAWCGVLLSLPAVALTSWIGGRRGFSSRDLGYGAVARRSLRRSRPDWRRVVRWAGSAGLLAGAADQLFLPRPRPARPCRPSWPRLPGRHGGPRNGTPG